MDVEDEVGLVVEVVEVEVVLVVDDVVLVDVVEVVPSPAARAAASIASAREPAAVSTSPRVLGSLAACRTVRNRFSASSRRMSTRSSTGASWAGAAVTADP